MTHRIEGSEPVPSDHIEVPAPTTEDQVITFAYSMGDVLRLYDESQGEYIIVPERGAISVMTNKCYAGQGADIHEERTVTLMRDGWMQAAVGSGAAVFEGNINEGRAQEIYAASGVLPHHVVAVGAHMDVATIEAAAAFFEAHPDCAFETDYYIGRDGIVKVSVVPVDMDDRQSPLPDIPSLSMRRIISDVTPTDLELMMAMMKEFVADITRKKEDVSDTPKEIVDDEG